MTADAAFRVTLRRRGTTIRVPAGTSVLDALRDAGVRVDSMCQSGLCGTCQTRVLDGAIDHRDTFLTDAERESNRFMMVCVSRAADGDLVLDL